MKVVLLFGDGVSLLSIGFQNLEIFQIPFEMGTNGAELTVEIVLNFGSVSNLPVNFTGLNLFPFP
jgi:hypothetical protein